MAERLIYLPLGGAGEIGMNAYVYGYGLPGKERLILVDLGVTFGDMEGSPGIDLIMPDHARLKGRQRRGLGVVHVPHSVALRDKLHPVRQRLEGAESGRDLRVDQPRHAHERDGD